MTRPIISRLRDLLMMLTEGIPIKLIPPRLAPIYEPTCNPDVSGACTRGGDLSVIV